MKIKWNWGTGLLIAGGVFMLMLIVFGFFMFHQEFDLVEKDYYPKALEYQKQIHKAENTHRLGEKVTFEYKNDTVYFTFPSHFRNEKITGRIYFYRPSAKIGDVIVDINTDLSGKMSYSAEHLMEGNYLLKMDYSVNDTEYYQEESLFVP